MSHRRKQLGPIQRLVSWFRSFRRVDGIDLPNDGRSSVESATSGIGALAFGSVLPPFDGYFETLRALKDFSIKNADLSQMVGNVVALANTGHNITIDAASDSVAEAALNRLNESAARLSDNSAGVDGLINKYIRQSAVFGAVSSEDVVDITGRRVDRVAIVPVEQIRFRYVDGQYQPFQQAPLTGVGGRGTGAGKALNPFGLIPLNANTYKYLALETIENSPYAIPPATAAEEILAGPQKDAIDNIKFIVQKLGLLGFVRVMLRRPTRKSTQTESEYRRDAQTYLNDVAKALDGQLGKGMLITFDDQKVEHSSVTGEARGGSDIFQTIEELAMSGMKSMPFMHGRNYTTTETFADVLYYLLLSNAGGHQRLAKRRQEATYRLDLVLAGIQVDGLSLQFNEAKSRNALQSAQAEEIRQRAAIERASRGIISPDDCAQELGYESAFDPELLSSASGVAEGAGALRAKRAGFSATFRFDRQSQRYRFVTSRIALGSSVGADLVSTASGSDRVIDVDFQKKRKTA